MKDIRALFSISTLAVAAVTALSLNITLANAEKKCASRADCACQVALASGSRASLRLFLKLYPHSDTLCSASASTGDPLPVGQVGHTDEHSGSALSSPSQDSADTNSGNGSGGDSSSGSDSSGDGDSVDSSGDGGESEDDNSDGGSSGDEESDDGENNSGT